VVTKVDAAARFPLGYEVEIPAGQNNQGAQTWIYVQTGATLAQGQAVMRATAATTANVVVATALIPNLRIMGVAQHAVASGSFGFVLKQGIGECLTGDAGNDQQNEQLVVHDATGRVDVMAGGEEACVFAFGTESVAGAGNLVTCWINCPG